MTTGQKLILVVLAVILILLAVVALVVTGANRAKEAEPTIAKSINTWTPVPPSATPIFIPPTWTLEPTPTRRPTDTPTSLPTNTPLPSPSPTFVPTFTPRPTATPTPTLPKVFNPTFDGLSNFVIPGWSWWALDNYEPGGAYDPATSYETPLFKAADDYDRIINGSTLQIEGASYVRFKVHVYQTIEAEPGLNVRFQAKGGGWASDNAGVILMVGIDRHGNDGCQSAQWGEMKRADAANSPVFLLSPNIIVGQEGKITVCLYAEPQYAVVKNSAFFDDAEVVVNE